jgi:hypothetical protein
MRLVGRPSEHYSVPIATRYLRDELEFSTDLAYQSDEEGFAPPSDSSASPGDRWAWDQGSVLPGTPGPSAAPAPPGVSGSGDGPPGGSQPWLRRAMEHDPALRAFVAAGLYDSLNSCADNAYLVANVAPWGSRITAKCYDGGHMMYDIKTVRRQLQRDVAAFIRSTS